jgi:hypothetical protein
MKNHPTDAEIVRALTPWFPSIASLQEAAEERQLQAVGILGVPRRSERAGDFHRAWRTLARFWCDETNGLFRLVEEKEGLGLDCIVCELIPDKPFVIRPGRFNGSIVKRNSSHRQNSARAHGKLSSEFLFPGLDDPAPGQLRQVTTAYSIEDDRTLGGKPAWYMAKLQLGREQFDGFELLADISHYSAPVAIAEDVKRVVGVARQDELEAWRKQIGDARKHG